MLRSFILESTALARIKGHPIHTSFASNPSRKHRTALKKLDTKPKASKHSDEKGSIQEEHEAQISTPLLSSLGRAVKRKGIVGLRFYEKAYTAVSKRYTKKLGAAFAEDIAGKFKANLGNITIKN